MSYNYLNTAFDPLTHGVVPANDNADWTADLWLTARYFTESRLRYLRTDPRQLTLAGRIYRARLLQETLKLILFTWRAISRR
jgi:hypothetical protein